MDLVRRFEGYADAFEETYQDDDWSRLQQYFTGDAVHERHAGVVYSFRHEGRETVIEKLRDMVSNVDRKFDRRLLVRTGPLEQRGEAVRMPWVGIYILAGIPALLGEGAEMATFEGGKIKRLEGQYTEDTVQRMIEWATKYGHKLPGVAEYLASMG